MKEKQRPAEQGFTLVEMMIVVAVIAILAAIAYPSYKDYIVRGRIQDGVAALSNGKLTMEQYFLDNHSYQAIDGSGVCDAGGAVPASSTKYFSLSCADVANTTFTLQASGASQMAGFTYTINQGNKKQTLGVGAGWPAHLSPKDCWILKKDGSC